MIRQTPLDDIVDAPWILLEQMIEAMEKGYDPSLIGNPNGQPLTAYAEPYPSTGLESIAAAIRTEANRAGRAILIDAATQAAATEPYALPLVASWAKGHGINNIPTVGTVTGIPPQYQYQLLQQGRHILPWFGTPAPNKYGIVGEDELWDLSGEQSFIQTCSALSLPISFVQGGQWEQLFDANTTYCGSNYISNNYWRSNPSPGLGFLSPAGTSNTPWTTLGNRSGSATLNPNGSGGASQLGTAGVLYPNTTNPQRIVFVSNDEMKRVPWAQVPEYSGYSPETARDVWGTRFTTVYNQLFTSFRSRLPASWGGAASFISYKAYGFDGWSRASGWIWSSAHCNKHGPSPYPYHWDGAAVQTYPTVGEDNHLCSAFSGTMNFPFMADAALAAKSNYWQETTVRDDNDLPAARWGAFCRHSMWLLRPRVVRIFEDANKILVDNTPMRDRLKWALNEVDSIWADSTLSDFWKWGRLLHNDNADGASGPFITDVPLSTEVPRKPRWFRLTVDKYGDSADPNYPFSDQKTPTTLAPLVIPGDDSTAHYHQDVDIWSLAIVKGPLGQRQWLVYLFSSQPTLEFGNVNLSIPDDLVPNTRLQFKNIYAFSNGGYFHFTEGANGQPVKVGQIYPPVNQALPTFTRIVAP